MMIATPSREKEGGWQLVLLMVAIVSALTVVASTFAPVAPSAQGSTSAIAVAHHTGAPSSGQPAATSSFTPGFIIADQNFYSHDAMSQTQIQSFLNERIGTCLSDDCLNVLRVDLPSYPAAYSSSTGALLCSAIIGGSNLLASTVIFKVQQACGISARVILVTLQKEQGLITSRNPSNYALSYAMGWACPDSTGCVDPDSWFGYQVYRGGRQLVTYRLANFARQPGTHQIAFSPSPGCGSTTVKIVNYATAALYNYTPYQPTPAALAAWPNAANPYSACNSYGNRNFWFFYNQWFGNPTAVVPDPPTGLTVGTNDGSVLGLSWTVPDQTGTAPVTGYHVEYKRSISTQWTRVAGSPITTAYFEFIGPSLGVSFDFRVRAVNRFGVGEPSTEVTAQTPSPPSAPTGVAVTVNDGTALTLSWGAPSSLGSGPVVDYVVQYRRQSSSTWLNAAGGVTTGTSFTFVNPTPGVAFAFRVVARNAFGAGSWSPAVLATTPSR